MAKPPLDPPTISIEEAKRRRAEKRTQQAKPKAAQEEPPPRANGHDHHSRILKLEGWHELGESEAADSLISGIVGPEQLAMIYGESGSGKSFATFDMFAHYAMTREWLGHKVKGGACLYIAAEGRGSWANRVEAFCQHHGLDEEARVMIPFKFIRENINLGRTGNGDVAAVIDAAKRFADQVQLHVDLIAVDTVARATPGSNENDAADMGAFVANMDRVRTALRTTVALVHHSGKNAALGARGHSSLRAAVDSEIEVERINGTKNRMLKVRKSRDGTDDGEAQAFALAVIEIGKEADGTAITSCVVTAGDAIEAARQRAVHKKRQIWMQALDVLNTVMIDAPADHPGRKTIPQNVTLTSRKRFAESLRRSSLIEIKEHDLNDPVAVRKADAAYRQSFKRLCDELRDRGYIRFDEDMLWRCDLQ
jgi:RecA/RadA recombinase